MVSISGMVSMYYNVIIMYSIYYMFVSFVNLDDTLPWQTCGNSWNTEVCRTEPYPDLKTDQNETSRMAKLMGKPFQETFYVPWMELRGILFFVLSVCLLSILTFAITFEP